MSDQAIADDEQPSLLALDDYHAPSVPVEHALRTLWKRLKQRFRGKQQDAQAFAGGRLRATSVDALDDIAGPPACGPLMEELDRFVANWLADPTAPAQRLVVSAPCDHDDLLLTWAKAHHYDILEAPAQRTSDSDETPIDLQALEEKSGKLLVIPRLEGWILRTPRGLTHVRMLLDRIGCSRRLCLIGCNSYAWAFLVKAASADLIFSAPHTFSRFDGQRLGEWFREISGQTAEAPVRFRLATNGADVLEVSDKGVLKNNHLQQLAARSQGIPWVAWHLWRRSLRTGTPLEASQTDASAMAKSSEAGTEDESTFWIVDAVAPQLPVGHEEDALLVLHALLIHGALTHDHLAAVLPDPAGLDTVPALLRSGVIQPTPAGMAVCAAAYPVVRSALKADGFPVGVL